MQATTSSPLRFRRQRSGDEAFLARLSAAAFGEYKKNAEWTTLEMARRGVTWLAFRGERPLGFAIYESPEPSRAELTAIAVDESARGMGVAAALLARVERELIAAGVHQLRLHTATANLSALELFLKRGFRITRRLPRFYRGVFDACELLKPLSSARR